MILRLKMSFMIISAVTLRGKYCIHPSSFSLLYSFATKPKHLCAQVRHSFYVSLSVSQF